MEGKLNFNFYFTCFINNPAQQSEVNNTRTVIFVKVYFEGLKLNISA